MLRDILREKWNFQGHVVFDCWAIRDFHESHLVTSSPMESAAMALNAGCDLNCGNTYLHVLNAYINTDDVIQLYIHNDDSPHSVRNTALCAFKRIHVKAGARMQVHLPIDKSAFTVVNEAGERIVDGTHYTIYAATFQPDKRSRELCGKEPVVCNYVYTG